MALVSLGIGAWGLVTGVAMVKSGLSPLLAVLMSLTVYAGSAQLASLPLLAAGAPLWLIWATAFCVNLRFVIFSVHWRPHFMHLRRTARLWHAYLSTDMGYVLFMRRYPQPVAPERRHEAMDYYWGGALTNWFAWQLPSMMGIALADAIPTEWGLEFAGTMALLALVCALVKDLGTVLSVVVAGGVALWAVGWPLRLNILAAICLAVLAGSLWDGLGRRLRRARS